MTIKQAGRGPLHRRRTISKRLRRPGKTLVRSRVFAAVLARLAIWYLKLTFRTNSWEVDPPDALDRAKPYFPVIGAVWHGQHVLLPAIPLDIHASVMISKSLDGEITARVAEAFGSKAIRASGGRESRKLLQKGGITGFLEMLNALENGESVMQTADIPKGTPRKAGMGIIQLARRSGRPIIPLAVASSRRKVFAGAWDRTTFNLPFGKSAICMGSPIKVPQDADDLLMEEARKALQLELNRITKAAYKMTGVPE